MSAHLTNFFLITSRALKLACAGLCICFGSLWLSSTAFALSSDKKQGLVIDADQTEIDIQSGTTTYIGDVVFQQGSMRIQAERVVIYREGKTPTKFIATGTPALYTQRPSESEGPVTAKAKTLEYKIADETLLLINEASLDQDGRQLSGNRIEYDVKRAIVKAHSANKKGKQERVRMVIPHSTLSADDSDESEPNAAEPNEQN